MKKTILEYSISFGICAVLTLILIAVKGTFTLTDPQTIYHYLTDSFFTTGVICAGLGLLVVLSNWGAFDFLIYGFIRFISLFKKDPNNIKHPTYYDYHVYRAEKDKPEFLYLVIIGFLFIGVSMIFLSLWYPLAEASKSST